jgi:hypothetical protein
MEFNLCRPFSSLATISENLSQAYTCVLRVFEKNAQTRSRTASGEVHLGGGYGMYWRPSTRVKRREQYTIGDFDLHQLEGNKLIIIYVSPTSGVGMGVSLALLTMCMWINRVIMYISPTSWTDHAQ